MSKNSQEIFFQEIFEKEENLVGAETFNLSIKC